MNFTILDWSILIVLLVVITAVAVITNKYTQSVADFLAANRCAKRYLLCISQGIAGMGAISIVAIFEMYYKAGFTAMWWKMMMIPIALLIVLSGFVSYRYRETRVFTLAQFFETRYSKSFRVFAGILAWVSGIVNFGIFPAVGARFFKYYCGLPDYINIRFIEVGQKFVQHHWNLPNFKGTAYLFNFDIDTFALIMLFLLGISLFFVFIGGQIAVMITDFVQGMFVNIVFLVVLLIFLYKFDWNTIISTLQTAPEGQSMINPFRTAKMADFGVFYFIIGAFGSIYNQRAWQGAQGYACSAKNAHELRMGSILGEWRGLVQMLIIMMLPIGAWVVMHRPEFKGVADAVHNVLNGIPNPQIQKQMMVPVTLTKFLPIGITGLFGAVMLAAFISTHDTYMHSWGSIFIQDVILPFRKKPFTPKQHIWMLRGSVFFVAAFIFVFSFYFSQTQYILMFFSITGAIFLGGAGSCIIGGLYWKRGSTKGAWTALVSGCVIAFGGLFIRQSWKDCLYPWLENHPTLLKWFTNVIEGIANAVPGINWKVTPENFPLNGQWFLFLAMITAIIGYVGCSLFDWLILKKEAHDMDRLLHRGKYAIKGEHGEHMTKPPTGWRAILPSKEFTGWDRVIYYAKMSWTLGWFGIFIVGTSYNLYLLWSKDKYCSDAGWSTYWWWHITVTLVLGIGTTIWFLIGGIVDVKDLFKTLSSAKRDLLDVGMVVDHHNLGENPHDAEEVHAEALGEASKFPELEDHPSDATAADAEKPEADSEKK